MGGVVLWKVHAVTPTTNRQTDRQKAQADLRVAFKDSSTLAPYSLASQRQQGVPVWSAIGHHTSQ